MDTAHPAGDPVSNRENTLLRTTNDLSTIPAGATINSATLYLYHVILQGDNPHDIALHGVIRAWTESGSTWNTYDGTNNWGTAGALASSDINTTAMATESEDDAAGFHALDCTDYIADKFAGTGEGEGINLLLPNASGPPMLHRWRSSEDTTGSTTRRPEILIDYTTASGGVTPSTGIYQYRGNTPTVQRLQTLNPSTGVIQFTGNTPDLERIIRVDPVTGVMEFRGGTPTLERVIAVNPQTGAVHLIGGTPTATREQTLSPTTGLLHLLGGAATVQRHVTLDPTTGVMHFTGNVPSINAGAIETVTPITGLFEFRGGTPLLEREITTLPTTGIIQFTGHAPSIAREITVTVDAGQINLTGNTPSIGSVRDRTLTPLSGVMHLKGLAPNVSVPVEITIEGGGSGRFDGIEIQLRAEDEELLMFISEFLDNNRIIH